MTPKRTEAIAAAAELSARARLTVLVAAFLGLMFDGIELGLMPVASLSISKDLLGASYTASAGGEWFARFTASLMLGAAVGGVVFGNMGDRIGRARGLGVSVLVYSLFSGLGAYVRTSEQMLVLRFLVGLGVGGVWPNGVALVSECWPNASRPFVSGILGAGINVGVLVLSQVTRVWPMTPESWRWIFVLAAWPAALGLWILAAVPESNRWKSLQAANRAAGQEINLSTGQQNSPGPLTRWLRSARTGGPRASVRELFRPGLFYVTLMGILLSSVPLIGAWAGSKWMIPWADAIGGPSHPGYKSVTQGWWAVGATLGSFLGAPFAKLLGRRLAYFCISLGAAVLTWVMFQWTAPLDPSFLPIVFSQGLVATLFFGWLPLYLPELFPLRLRATGSGIAINAGRFATAGGVFAAGSLFAATRGNYATIGAACALVYAAGIFVILGAPETHGELAME